MRRLAIALMMVFCVASSTSLACSGQDSPSDAAGKIRLPHRASGADDTPRPAPVPGDPKVVSSLAVEDWYVVESDMEIIALQSPDNVLDIEATHGPITVRGKFADGTGKIETRVYTSSYVYFVTAKKPGKTELILIPLGVKMESEIVRQELTVTDGTGPNPPPDPFVPDPVEPDVPVPVASFRVIFVKESGATLSPEQSAIPNAKALRDYLNAKTTQEGGRSGWREYDPQQNPVSEQPTMKALWQAVVPQITSVPCMVVEVNGHATVMPFPENVDDALATLKKSGGD